MNGYWTESWRLTLAFALIGAAWLVFLSGLMIADVWDESQLLQQLPSDPRGNMRLGDTILSIWTFERPQISWRPLALSVFFTLATATEGDFVWLRYCNALLVLCSASLLARSLMLGYGVSANRGLAFFAIVLFSASSLITAGWFANIFDALCLFFLALAIRSHVSGRLLACAVFFSLAVFCKETHVLALPLLALMILRDSKTGGGGRKTAVFAGFLVLAVSIVYWGLRHRFVPIGSETDIHGMDFSSLIPTMVSFASGFVTQSYTFWPGNPAFWVGGVALPIAFLAVRGIWPKMTVLAIFGMSTIIYLGMFGYQMENLMGAHNFIGRLYLIPFALILFVAFSSTPRPTAILFVALFSVWGMGQTYSRHVEFQQTYAALYALAEEAEETITVQYPPRSEVDVRRGLRYGDFPDAEISINVEEGGIDGCQSGKAAESDGRRPPARFQPAAAPRDAAASRRFDLLATAVRC